MCLADGVQKVIGLLQVGVGRRAEPMEFSLRFPEFGGSLGEFF